MIEIIKEFLHILALLVHPGSTPFLIAFTAVLTIAVTVMLIGLFLMLSAWGKDERFNKARKIGPVWVHLMGGNTDPSELVKAEAAAPAPVKEEAPYRKLLYVKVIHLNRERPGATPIYVRSVERLEADEREVRVFDEAVYYTLKRFPMQQPIPPETDTSSGVVDSRLLMPWTDIDSLPFASREKHTMRITSEESSDTLCSVSHFYNGLQKDGEQNICTYADQDAATLGLVVDFSSVPDAAAKVSLLEARLKTGTRETSVPYRKDGDVYLVQHANAKKGELLQMEFRFAGWE